MTPILTKEDLATLPRSRKEALAAGSRFYYNGRTCPSGHTGKYLTDDYTCYECVLAKHRRQNREHKKNEKFRQVDHAATSLCRHTRRYMLELSYRTRTSKLIGCNGATLRTHMEDLFEPGMSWENYGRAVNQWQMDHKVPLSKFDLHNPEQAAAAGHYTNVQPMWSGDNARKSWTTPK